MLHTRVTFILLDLFLRPDKESTYVSEVHLHLVSVFFKKNVLLAINNGCWVFLGGKAAGAWC